MGALFNVKSLFDTLTPGEQRIASYMLENPDFFVVSSTQSISAYLGISSASLDRFAKKLGYTGVTQLKREIDTDLKVKLKSNTLDSIHIEPSDTPKDLSNKLLLKNQIILTRLFSKLDYKSLTTAVEHIRTSNKIYLYGLGGSGLASIDLQFKLNWIDINAVFFHDLHLALSNLNYADQHDTLICHSISGNTNEVISAVKRAQNVNAYTIAITGDKHGKLARLADTTLTYPKDNTSKRLDSINSRTCMFSINDLIYELLIKDDIDAAYEKIERTRRSKS